MGGLGVWPYGVQVIFYFIGLCSFGVCGVNDRFMFFGPIYVILPYGVYGRCIIFGPMVYRAFFFFLFRHTV